MTQATSPYLNRPLRTLEEVAAKKATKQEASETTAKEAKCSQYGDYVWESPLGIAG